MAVHPITIDGAMGVEIQRRSDVRARSGESVDTGINWKFII